MKMSKSIAAICLTFCLTLVGCGTNATSNGGGASTTQASEQSGDKKIQAIDYMVLVNKLHALPDGWEEALETVHMTNSAGEDVVVEKKTYDAYLELKADLEKEGVYVDLDNGLRTVAEQQKIMDDFTKEYGEAYAKKTVATPGYSEHHTGLAVDLYLRINGQDVRENEDMEEYPEVWTKIHQKLADHGFILHYLPGLEHLTGYGHEVWHIRYIDNVETAKKITSAGLTLEEYLGAVKAATVSYDYGESKTYSRHDLEEAVVQLKCEFAKFDGCELHSIRYAGDEANTKENLDWLNSLSENAGYTQVAKFVTDFHSPVEGGGAWEADKEMTNYEWWLARKEGDGWQVVSWGY